MTNYRLTMCAYHDKPQFNYCFDCGAPLEEYEPGVWVCSKSWVHVRISLDPGTETEHEDGCERIRNE